MTAPGRMPEGPRARILAAATDQVRQFGIARLNVVLVARTAGMTHANVYRYFPSKSALAEEIVAGWLRGVEQRLAEITQAPDPAYDKLERFLTLLARSYDEKSREDAEIFGILADEAAPSATGRHRQRISDLLGRIIDEGITTRAFASGDVRRTEQLVLDAMHRFVDPGAVREALMREGGRGPSWESRRERATRLVVRGLSSHRE